MVLAVAPRGRLFALLPVVALSCLLDESAPAYSIGKAAVQAISTSADAGLTVLEKRFVQVPNGTSARESLRRITSQPHVAGTDGDLKMAEYMIKRFQEAGIEDVRLDPQRVLLTYPVNRSLALVDGSGATVFQAPLAEDIIPTDGTSDTWWRNHTFHGYSPSGSTTAHLVYANFGLPEDFAALEAAGVSVRGAVVIMRYGECFRGLKAMNAQKAGAAAAIIYSDPEQDGFARGSVYPNGPWRPKSSVQRGSTQFNSLCGGDPARAYKPHGKSVEEMCGMGQDDLIPQIPVLPISWGDAVPLLESLGGPEAPPRFRGALNITYRTGPSNLHAALKVHNRFQKSAVWNVIATIPGSLPPEQDQPVVLGNHRDAWVYGAADPNSGTAQMIEVARGFGALLQEGWRPRRTIIFGSWSGEEYGLLGSTAWAEVNSDLLSRAVAYLNVDTGVSGKHFRASGTPSLGNVLAGVLGQLEDPGTGKPLSEEWDEGRLYTLGSGSDYTAFIDYLGIASLDMAFVVESGQYGVYHSSFDSFAWMNTEGDPTWRYHETMAKMWGLVALRLAGEHADPAAPLPFNFTLQARAIGEYIAEEKAAFNGTAAHFVNFAALDDAHLAFAAAAESAMQEAAQVAAYAPSPMKAAAVAALDERFALLERRFLLETGLPGRKWFRHCLQAPGLYTGYAPQALPGVHHATRNSDWATAQAQADAAADRIRAAAQFLANSMPTGTLQQTVLVV